MRDWFRRLTRLGVHSVRQASFGVWQILLTANADYVPQPAGRHRTGVAPGTDAQRKAQGLAVDPWAGAPVCAWAEAWVTT